MSLFNGKAENIENNLNKVKSINPAVTDNQYPSAKAVYEYAKKDYTYNPTSENAQTGMAVAQAISHFDTVLKSGNTFIFDGGRPSGKIDIDLVVDDTLDPQSQNPLQNAVTAQLFSYMQENVALTAGEIDNLKNENQNQSLSINELEKLVAQKVLEIYTNLQVEEGSTESGWEYIKYPNKSFIAWGTFNVTLTKTTSTPSDNEVKYEKGYFYFDLPFSVASGIATASTTYRAWVTNLLVDAKKQNVRCKLIGSELDLSLSYPIYIQITGRCE